LQALRAAHGHSLQLQAEDRAVGQAKAATVVAATRPNLELNLQPIQLTNRAHQSESVPFFSLANQQLWFQLTKNLQVAGQRGNKIRLAQDNLRLREIQRTGFAAEHYRQVALLWLEGWEKAKKIQVLGYEVEDIRRVIEFLRQRGAKPESSEMVRAALIGAEYAARLNKLRSEYQNTLAELRLHTGLPTIADIDTVAPMRGLGMATSRDSLLRFALAHRPEVNAARQAQRVASSRHDLERSNRWGQPAFGYIYNPQNLIPYWGVFANIPIPSFDRKVGERQMAQQELARAKVLTTLAEQRLEMEIGNAWRNYEAAQQNAKLLPPLMALLTQDFERIKGVFFQGQNELTLLNFLEAERELYQAQFLQLEHQVAEYRALVELMAVSHVLARASEAD
jgi:cobalt-zinc-cadmium efflux system outer membrane protein